ncbi:pilus assembly protein [Altererythrobacter sp. RZ02]|uniref:Pilus assembly protein n=1 Tax=Pontixanthobacter rizhaonensis TaxID=2730337 RepID=A0A848QL62_9SPHN|nr:TadE family protein [Pontixanthobacter rizhaonensis]NMW31460.1 pilus assembly protein [Pontixanthobacter rizhaonensis]
MNTLSKFAVALRNDKKAAALTEFALATPLVLTLGLWGLETANLAMMHMRVNQAAMQIADNAARIGDTSTLSNQKIYEDDLNDILRGMDIQAGESIDLYQHGRVIISSLQVEPGSDPDQQYIAWQRCKGRKEVSSSYGDQGTGVGDPSFTGMGPAGEEVTAIANDAVMFVEVQYNYQPLATDAFISDPVIRSRAAFQVRASRDLTQIYERNPGSPAEIARCDIFDSYKEAPPPPRKTGGWSWIFSDDPNAGGGSSSSSGGSSSTSGGSSGGSSSPGGGTTNNSGTGDGSGNGGNNNSSSGGNDGTGDGSNGNGNNDDDGQWCPSWNWWC